MNNLFIILSFIPIGNALESFFLSPGNHMKLSIYERGDKIVSENPEQFTVLFALNSSNLSLNGQKIVKLAARKIINQGATRVLIVGHTDQLGNPEYNLRLSRRRTVTVLQRLQQEGVSPTVLNADWKGEFDPKIPAGENGVEPRNRRVEIQVF